VSLWRCIASTEYAHLKNTSRHWRVVVKQSQKKYVNKIIDVGKNIVASIKTFFNFGDSFSFA